MNKITLLCLALAAWITFPVLAVVLAHLGISWATATILGSAVLSVSLCVPMSREYILDKLTI